MIARLLLFKIAIARDPNAQMYTDQALTPVRELGGKAVSAILLTSLVMS
jgi:hypothetical protein